MANLTGIVKLSHPPLSLELYVLWHKFQKLSWKSTDVASARGKMIKQWSYSTVRKYSKPYLCTLGNNRRDTLP